MALSEFKQGSVICSKGEPLNQLSLIIMGNAEMSLGGKPFRYEQGDMIGLYDLHTGAHSHTYTAVSDSTLITYAFDNFSALETLLRTNADVSKHMVNSMCRQISTFFIYRDSLKREACTLYDALKELYPEYVRLCELYALTPKKIPGLSDVTRFSGSDALEDWEHKYYIEINDLDFAARKGYFYTNPGISFGFIYKSAKDILRASEACLSYQEYLKGISVFFLNKDGHDLFSVVSDLHVNSVNNAGADAAVAPLMEKLTKLLSDMTGIDPDYYQERLNAYSNALSNERSTKSMTDAPAPNAAKRNLSDSLNVILHYSGCSEEVYNKFTKGVQDYTKLHDRNSSDDENARRLRKELTALFYDIYQLVFKKSLTDPALSTVIKMFLKFGYVDAELAGHENADYLYSIADSLKGDPNAGVYTVTEWLSAIYNGEKEPSRNEFDLNYPEYLNEKKTKGEIDAKEETRLLADQGAKLTFEIENLFPIVNKLTFGRILTFCPLFAEQNVLAKLEASLVTSARVKDTLDEVRGIDFSAYYREILYTNPKTDVTGEYLHIEVLPDIILMPNVGTRGVLWQEIDGKNRRTPARMFISQFAETDLKTLIINLTGEFRWEICKRIQGIRWNDVTTPSLTSLFSDYLQFYKGNRELTQEAKDLIKTEFDRSKRNNRTMFAMTYAKWILKESNGSPQLNKVVFQIMAEYCPFSATVREKLAMYPRYTEMLNRYKNNQQKRTHHLSNTIQYVTRMTKVSPQELLEELEYAKN